jgi:hypothetical protein
MTLTREQVLEMKAGDVINRLIALNIMGFEPSDMRDGWVRMGALATYPKQFSTDISAAWEVADKLKIAIIPQSTSAPDKLKYLARAEWDFRQLEIDVFAETAPLAICRVALLTTIGEET